jgi:hypothetical protein
MHRCPSTKIRASKSWQPPRGSMYSRRPEHLRVARTCFSFPFPGSTMRTLSSWEFE